MSGRRLEKRPSKDASQPDAHVGGHKKKRETIGIACTSCQKRKSKCDGGKPLCSLCTQKGTHCEYPDDSRRTVNLRAQNQKLTSQLETYRDLTQLLRTGSVANAEIIDQTLLISRSQDDSPSTNEPLESSPGDLSSEIGFHGDSTANNLDSFIPMFKQWEISPANASNFDSQLTLLGENVASDAAQQAAVMHSRKTSITSHFEGPSGHSMVSAAPSSTTPSSLDSALFDNTQTSSERASSIETPTYQPETSAATPKGSIKVWQAVQNRELSIPPHFVLPLSFIDDFEYASFSNQYARVYASFLRQKREELAKGTTEQADFLRFDTVDGRIILADGVENSTDSLSAFVHRLVKAFHNDPITILAFMHIKYRMMQWLIRPTEESFNRLPSIMRPLAEQISIGHPCWIDFEPLPGLRRVLTTSPEVRGRDCLSMLSTCRIDWSHSLEDTLLFDRRTGRWSPSPAFQERVDNPEAWTLAFAGKDKFPEFSGQVNFREV